MIRRWWKEYVDFFFTKGNALNIAIAFIVGQQFTKIADGLSKDLLMPLINPLIPHGSYKDLTIDYFGGEIAIGRLLDTTVEALLVGWSLFIVMKAIKRIERLAETTDQTSKDEAA